MFLKRITNCLLFLTLIYHMHTDAEDDFRATEGETVDLPCHLPPNDSIRVSVECKKHTTTVCKFNINNNTRSPTEECLPRFNFNTETFRLRIVNVQLGDSGNYSCKITRIIPPPSLDNTSNMTLRVAVHPHLSLEKLNSSNATCVHLLCSLEGLMAEQVNFTWSREGQGSLNALTSYDMKSELRLCQPDWSNGDTITCNARYSSTQFQKKSIQLSSHSVSDKDVKLLIIACSFAAGLVICIILIIVICKCRKRDESAIVFSNKVYENFSFAMARQNTLSSEKPQPEECIYEN